MALHPMSSAKDTSRNPCLRFLDLLKVRLSGGDCKPFFFFLAFLGF